jgi:sugar phosphate isomerase/epimerase
MKISQVAAQLSTIPDHLLSSSDFSRAIIRLKAIGYSAVELIPSDKVKDPEIVAICGDAGMTIAGVHVHESVLLAYPEVIAEKLETLGTKMAGYAYPVGVDLGSKLEVEQLASRLEQSAAVLQRAGLTLAYHNHAVEFSRIAGERVFDIIRRTAPTLAFELDAYWAQFGGVSPERLAGDLHGKLAGLHLKDFGFDYRHNRPFMTEVGNGNLDFPALVAGVERAGCEWFIVEQDETPGDPFDSLERSLHYVQHTLVAPPQSNSTTEAKVRG